MRSLSTFHRTLLRPLLLLFLTSAGRATAQVNVTTYHNDNSRTGQNTQETSLTSATFKSAFGKLFSVAVDGYVYAQPLILTNVTIGGGKHNVVYVATENDSVYAIDADKGTLYWSKNFIPSGLTTSDDYCGSGNISGGIGITGTPVIDSATNTIYFVTSTKQSGVGYYQRFHAVDVVTGSEKFGGPVLIGGSYQGTFFNAETQLQRPGLLLINGHVVIAFGQHCTNTAYGWVMSYNKSTLALEAILNTNPGTTNGSVWMGGAGVAADSSGNLFFATGDGSYDGVDEFGDSIIKIGQPSGGAFPFLDYFTPHDQGSLDSKDWDVGSGGVLVLPDLTSGTHRYLLVQAGKEGTIYLVDRTNMGTYCGSPTCSDRVVQELTGALVGGDARNLVGVWGSPAYWNGSVYFGSATKDNGNHSDYIKAYSFNSGGSGLLSASPSSNTPEQFAWPAPTVSISSNGTTNGIAWVLDNSGFASASPAVLHAYNAANLASEYFYVPGGSDQLGAAVKFAVPTVANGKVYVGGKNVLSVLGPLTVIRPTTDVDDHTFTNTCYIYDYNVGGPLWVVGTSLPYAYDADTTTSSTNFLEEVTPGYQSVKQRNIRGWPSAGGKTPVSLAMTYQCSAGNPGGNNLSACGYQYSTDGGNGWTTGFSSYLSQPTVQDTITLSPTQDLTKLQVRVCASGTDDPNLGTAGAAMTIYDVNVRVH